MNNYIKIIKKSKLFRGFIATLLGSGASKCILVIATFISSNMLGKMAFGEMSFVRNTLNMILCICALNFTSLCTKFTSEAEKSDISLQRLFLLFLFSILVSLFLGLVLLILPNDVLLTVLGTEIIVKFFKLIGIFLPLFILQPLIEGVLRGLKLFNLIGLMQTLTSVAYLLFVVIGIKLGELNGALIGIMLYYGIYSIASLIILHAKMPFASQRYRLNGFSKQKKIIWTMILPVFIMSFIDAPVMWGAQVILSKAGSMESVASMTAMFQIRNLAMLIPGYFTNTYLSFASELNAERRHIEYYAQFIKVERYYLLIGIICFVFLSILSPFILSLYGNEFSGDWPIMVVANIGIPLFMLISLYRMDLILKEHQRYLLLTSVIWNVIWLLVLVSMTKSEMNPLLSFFVSQTIATAVFVFLLFVRYRKDKNKLIM